MAATPDASFPSDVDHVMGRRFMGLISPIPYKKDDDCYEQEVIDLTTEDEIVWDYEHPSYKFGYEHHPEEKKVDEIELLEGVWANFKEWDGHAVDIDLIEAAEEDFDEDDQMDSDYEEDDDDVDSDYAQEVFDELNRTQRGRELIDELRNIDDSHL